MEGLFEIIKPIVAYINNILSKFVPDGEVYLVAVIAITIAYAIKSKNNWNNGSFLIAALVLYTSFRYIGFGGA